MDNSYSYKNIGLLAVCLAAVMVIAGSFIIMSADAAEPEKCTITFDTKGGSTIEPIEVDKGIMLWDALSLIADPTHPDELQFVGWCDEKMNAHPTAFSVDKDLTLYAKWFNPDEQVQVEFVCEIPNGYCSFIKIVEKGKCVSEPVTPKMDGFRFKGWYTYDGTDPETGAEVYTPFDFKQTLESDTALWGFWEDTGFFDTIKDNLVSLILLIAGLAIIVIAIFIRTLNPMVWVASFVLILLAFIIALGYFDGIKDLIKI